MVVSGRGPECPGAACVFDCVLSLLQSLCPCPPLLHASPTLTLISAPLEALTIHRL